MCQQKLPSGACDSRPNWQAPECILIQSYTFKCIYYAFKQTHNPVSTVYIWKLRSGRCLGTENVGALLGLSAQNQTQLPDQQ